MFRNDTACWLWVSVVTRRPWSIALHYSGIWKILICFFTSDSFEHKACDVSVASIQSQYTSLYITLVCKEEEKKRLLSSQTELWALCCRGQAACCLLPYGSETAVEFGSDTERSEAVGCFLSQEHRLKAELCNLLRPQLQVLHVCELITQHAVYSPFKHTKKVGKRPF